MISGLERLGAPQRVSWISAEHDALETALEIAGLDPSQRQRLYAATVPHPVNEARGMLRATKGLASVVPDAAVLNAVSALETFARFPDFPASVYGTYSEMVRASKAHNVAVQIAMAPLQVAAPVTAFLAKDDLSTIVSLGWLTERILGHQYSLIARVEPDARAGRSYTFKVACDHLLRAAADRQSPVLDLLTSGELEGAVAAVDFGLRVSGHTAAAYRSSLLVALLDPELRRGRSTRTSNGGGCSPPAITSRPARGLKRPRSAACAPSHPAPQRQLQEVLDLVADPVEPDGDSIDGDHVGLRYAAGITTNAARGLPRWTSSEPLPPLAMLTALGRLGAAA